MTYEEIRKDEAIKVYITQADASLKALGFPPEEIAFITTAIGNHDEGNGQPVNELAAALILADKAAEKLGLQFKRMINEQ